MSEKLLTVEDCDAIVQKYLKTEKVHTVDFSAVQLQDGNYRIKIAVSHEKTLNFFGKSTSDTSEITQKIFNDFKKVVPGFDPEITPKVCYEKPGLLIFEDLTWQKFASNVDFLDLDHFKIVLRVLAQFHSGCFAYKEIGQIYRLDHKYDLIYNVTDLKKNETIEFITSLLDDKSEKNISKIVANVKEAQSSSKFRRTLCHGNLIPRNILFRYEKDAPVECKLINFQSKLYAPPVCDVLQVIFFNSDEDFRQHHFESLLLHYYKCLEEELDKYHMQIDNIVPRDDWQVQAHRFLPLIKLETNLRFKKSSEELKEDLNCPILSRQDCHAIIRNKIKTTNYKLISFKVTPVDAVTGVLGSYHKLQVTMEHQSFDCFLKCMPESNASLEVVQDSNSFFKEACVYGILIPKFQNFGITTIEVCVPECYFQRPEDVMVLEDMTVSNYKALPATTPYDFETLCLIIKKLAKFHASAFIYEEKKSAILGSPYRLNEEYPEFFKEAVILEDDNHSGAKLMATGVKSIPDATNLFPEIKTEENEKNFKKFWPKFTELFYSTLTASDRFRNVLSHGDLWSGNILIRYENDKPIDCRFIDYQLLRYCLPGHDFVSILHLATLRTTRLTHEEELKRIYHEELSRILESYHLEVDKILPYEDFIGGVDLMRAEMVMQAAIYCTLSMCTPEQISSLLSNPEESHRVFYESRKDFITKMCEISPVFKSRLRDRILDVYDYCNSMSE